MTIPEIEPLFTEIEAAKLVGIDWKWLRAERYAGHISWKKVAGRVMYRRQDLVDWQKRGIPCREEDPPANPASSSKRSKGERRSGSSIGTTESAAEKVQRVLANAERRIKSSRVGSSTTKTRNADFPQRALSP